jgi:hypothetical protein
LLGPEALVAIEPAHRLLHRPRGEAARHGAPGFRARDQAGVRQHVEVLHDRRQRHRKRPGQLAHRDAFLFVEPREQRAPRRVGECREGPVQGCVSILNHKVKYRGCGPRCQGAGGGFEPGRGGRSLRRAPLRGVVLRIFARSHSRRALADDVPPAPTSPGRHCQATLSTLWGWTRSRRCFSRSSTRSKELTFLPRSQGDGGGACSGQRMVFHRQFGKANPRLATRQSKVQAAANRYWQYSTSDLRPIFPS